MHFLPLLLALSTLSLSLSPAAAAGPPPRQKCLFICPASDLNGTPSDHSLEVGHRLDCGYLDEGVCAYDLRTGHLRQDAMSSNGADGANCPQRAGTKCWDSPKPVVHLRRRRASPARLSRSADEDEAEFERTADLLKRSAEERDADADEDGLWERETETETEVDARAPQGDEEWRQYVRDWRYVPVV